MIFYILTLFPEMFRGYLDSSILGKSVARGLNNIKLINIRDFATDKHRRCDDIPYGGGPGMLLKPEPLAGAIESIDRENRVVFLTPSGKLFNQRMAEDLSKEESLTIICGHYEGIDQRIIDKYVMDEISIGDYIFFSGEVGAMVVLDTVSRLEKGVISIESKQDESFSAGLLEYPQYTRPRVFKNLSVPEILTSGNHEEIRIWRKRKSLEKTRKYRPDLLLPGGLSDEEKHILQTIVQEEDGYGFDRNS